MGSSVLVVGGSSGIGFAAAKAAQVHGAEVVIASRSRDRLAQATALLGAVAAIELDVTDETSVASALSSRAPFDHVVVTSGRVRPMPVREGDIAVARKGMDAKFWGAYRVAAHAPIRERGSLTLVSGVFATRPAKGNVIGSCTNAAVEALARALALELAPVRVNAVSPGLIDTPLWSGMPDADRAALFESTKARLPVARIGAPDDIAELILACMTNRFMTGSVLVADGGHVLT